MDPPIPKNVIKTAEIGKFDAIMACNSIMIGEFFLAICPPVPKYVIKMAETGKFHAIMACNSTMVGEN